MHESNHLKQLFLLLGISEFLWTNDLNVLEIPEANSPTSTLANASITLTWLHNITDPNLDENENHESRGLGGGAIAGIVVGSLAGAMLVIITLVWMMRHANLGPLAIWEALISLIWDRR